MNWCLEICNYRSLSYALISWIRYATRIGGDNSGIFSVLKWDSPIRVFPKNFKYFRERTGFEKSIDTIRNSSQNKTHNIINI